MFYNWFESLRQERNSVLMKLYFNAFFGYIQSIEIEEMDKICTVILFIGGNLICRSFFFFFMLLFFYTQFYSFVIITCQEVLITTGTWRYDDDFYAHLGGEYWLLHLKI